MLYITGFYGVTNFKSIKDFSYKSGITSKIDRATLSEFAIPEKTLFADDCKEIYSRLLKVILMNLKLFFSMVQQGLLCLLRQTIKQL